MPTSAQWEPTDSPQIFVRTVRTARADVGIGPYNLLCRILTAEYSGNEQNQDPLFAIRNCL